MDELERIAIQLWEAKRLSGFEDVAHGRLALLLLDNAAETSMMRSARTGMSFAEMYGDMAYLLTDVSADDEEGQRLRRRVEAGAISRGRRRQIEHNFESLVDYVFEEDGFALAPEFSDCLKILHRYRNAAYHRDTVRPDVLGPAVQIYFFLCCHLLKSERHMVHSIDVMPTSVREIFGESPPTPTWGESFNTDTLRKELADHFLADLRLDHGQIAAALSDHLLARLKVLDRHLTTIGESIPPLVNREVTLRLVQQAPRDRENFETPTPADFWTRPLPITVEILDGWAAAATGLREMTVAHDALRAFAEIEQTLEQLEEPVGRFIDDIDRMVQRMIDESRGR